MQPLETAIVRSIDVTRGREVHAGQVLARLDPTFAAADLGALAAQVSNLQAQVSRLQAEAEGKPFTYTGLDPNMSLQAAIYGQRQAEFNFKIENYTRRSTGSSRPSPRRIPTPTGYRTGFRWRPASRRCARPGAPAGRQQAQHAGGDGQPRRDGAQPARRDRAGRQAQRDLGALVAERDGYMQPGTPMCRTSWPKRPAKLSDARELLNKAQLRRQLVELRADRDGTVLTVAKVSVGSVLQSGQQFITLVPPDAPLEVEANISGRDDGFVHVGDPVAIKFDTFPFVQYGMADGTVRIMSADSFTAQDEQRNPTGMVPLPANSGDPYLPRAHHHRSGGAALHAGRVPTDARHAGDRRHQGRQADDPGVPARPRAAGGFRGDARAVRATSVMPDRRQRCQLAASTRSHGG